MKENATGFDSSAPNEENSTYGKLWLGFPVVIIIWLAYWWVQSYLSKDSPFSDSPFDRLNTLFSGLAFWGVIYAILLQKSELILQRRELALTRNEVRGQKEQLQAQNTTLKQQRFENTFFSLLDLFSNMVNSMEIPPQGMGRTTKGRECLSLFSHEFDGDDQRAKQQRNDSDMNVVCREAYAGFYDRRQSYVDHYFRTLYHIVKFVDSSEVNDKQVYINFLRAQLSSSELKLLFYNCLGGLGAKKFKPLVQQYGLLDNLREEILIDRGHLKLFEKSATGDHD